MPLSNPPALSEWPVFFQTILQHLTSSELVLRKLLPALTVLSGLILLLYLLAQATVDMRSWWVLRRRTRVSRLLAKFQKIREKISGRGSDERLHLARARQNRNLKELAALVRKQLKAIKWSIQPSIYRRTCAFIKQAVTNLDFDRLYSLHHLLSQPDMEHLVPRLESLLHQSR